MWKFNRLSIVILAIVSLLLSTSGSADNLGTVQPATKQLKTAVSYDAHELRCMSEAIYHEARGESSRGQRAVAAVILNRVAHPAYPSSVCDVVYQQTKTRGGSKVCQFSWVCQQSQKRPNKESDLWQRVSNTAYQMINGHLSTPVGRALNFHATGMTPKWARDDRRVAIIGNHAFYR
jgi:spore germination cell wall hydrolase CwlJ-like protein